MKFKEIECISFLYTSDQICYTCRILRWQQICYTYTLFDGLAYNTCGYFAICVVYEQWAKCPLVLYAKSLNKRFIIPLQKKNVIWQLASIFLLRVFRSILIPSVRMTLTIRKMLARIICEKIEWEVNFFYCKRKMLFWLLFSSKSILNILILSAIVAPFASAGIRPVVNRLNQDTTVYYGFAFCLFYWPYGKMT